MKLAIKDKNGVLDTTRLGQLASMVVVCSFAVFMVAAAGYMVVHMIIEHALPNNETLSGLGAFALQIFGPAGVLSVGMSSLYQYKRKIKNGSGMPHEGQ